MEHFDDELRDVTRLHNRALRKVNRALRKQAERAKQQTDEVIAALFDAPSPESPAEEALRKVWEKTELKSTCRPDDYTKIANTSIEALNWVSQHLPQ